MALLAFPADFRARQGAALLQTIATDLEGARNFGQVGRLLANLWDLVRGGMAERLARRGQAGRGVAGSTGHGESRVRQALRRGTTDLRYAGRSLVARRGSSTAIIAVFSLGIGLATAMFVLADPYVFRPLPYARPHELAILQLRSGRGGAPPALTPSLDQWRSRSDLFAGIAAYTWGPDVWIRSDAGQTALNVLDVTENFFDVLGAGRGGQLPSVAAADEADIPVVLTPEGRRKVFPAHFAVGSFPGPHGRVVRIAGVLPDRLLLPGPHTGVDGLSTFESGPLRTVTVRANGGYSTSRMLTVVARVRPGLTLAAVSESLRTMMAPQVDYQVRAEWLSEVMTQDVRPLAMGALAAAVLVLFVCAGNVANLLAARDAWRVREFATREALGASRADVLRLRLLELLAIGAASLVIGLGLAGAALVACSRVIPAEYVTLGGPQITWRGLFCAVAGAGLVLVTALVPLLMTTARARTPHEVTAEGRGANRLRLGFLGMQSAFALVLSVGAAMLLQSYSNLAEYDMGVDRSALTVSVSPVAPTGQARRSARPLDVAQTLDRLRTLPRIREASARHGGSRGRSFEINGSSAFAFFEETMPAFFEAMGMRLVRGRALAPGDERWRAVVVNEAFVRTHWPGQSGLGQLVRRDDDQAEVVGVVRDVHELPLRGPAEPMIYTLVTEIPGSVSYVLSASGDPRAHVAAVRRTLAAAHPNAMIGGIGTVGGQLMDRVRDRTFATLVLTLFAVAAVVVTLAGLAGLVGFLVARRTREIAIRMAIGARPAHIRRLVARDTLTAACAGAVIGLLVGRWLSTWLESLVFGIEAGNWTTTLVAACAAVALMVLAALLPARRALRLQPTEALRAE
jgi:putative ABC transport system permease protein